MAMLMLGLGCVMGITGGISAAQNTCKYQQQTAQTLQSLNTFIQTAQGTEDTLQAQLDAQNQTIEDLTEQAMATANNLYIIKKEYVSSMKQKQLICVFIVITVFMLLLGKKLKVY